MFSDVCCAHPTEGNSKLNASSLILPMPTLTVWMLLCSPKCMTHSALGRHCRAQLFILAFSVNPPTEPLWTSSISMHVSWKQYNNLGLLCLLLAWLLKSSVVALYWKKWSVRLLAACVLSEKNYREEILACLFSITWIIYPLISVLPLFEHS